MTATAVRKLAKRIAADLFTVGGGQQATRLRLFNDRDFYLGGWSQTAVAERVEQIVTKATKPKPRKAKAEQP